ncbi:hypothetical protein FOCC_FOCC012458 [Frankliniella occidentalis]|nr:hypothetical protein FOCC_FOCC012458 [Frankliniella occidentalis]
MLLLLKRCSKAKCRTMQVLYRHPDFKGNYAAYCKKCKTWSNLCTGTFFEGTHVSFENCFVSMWTWICHVSQTDTLRLTKIPRECVNQYHRYFRDVASWKILSMPHLQLGGPGVIVQIDESVITRRKFKRGKGERKTIKEKWVLGIYDTEQKLGVVLDKATLVPLIRQYCERGSVLWTDGWAAYKGLDRFGYEHHVVNHSKEFKSADGTCTNGVEGYWSRLKQFCRHTNVLKSKLLAEHIDEFMYRQHFRGTDVFRFQSFLDHIKERYPV